MDDVDNPYLAPRSRELASGAFPSDSDDIDPRKIGKAGYVPTVAILLIVHGVLMLAAGLGLVAMMLMITPQIGQQIEEQQRMQRQQNPNAPQFTKEGMTTMLYAVYGGMSASLFLIAGLDLLAGVRNYGYRNRVLGVIALVLNMGSVSFCWCLPLSIGLMVFGMIIYLSPEADRAFQWRARQLQQPSEPMG